MGQVLFVGERRIRPVRPTRGGGKNQTTYNQGSNPPGWPRPRRDDGRRFWMSIREAAGVMLELRQPPAGGY